MVMQAKQITGLSALAASGTSNKLNSFQMMELILISGKLTIFNAQLHNDNYQINLGRVS